ncbi:MAG: histidine kinase [Bacteroidota bacterium]
MQSEKEKYWLHLAFWCFIVLFISDYHWYEISWIEALAYSVMEVLTYALIFYWVLAIFERLSGRLFYLILSILGSLLAYVLFIRWSGLEYYFYEAEGWRNLYSMLLNASLFSGLAVLFGETMNGVRLKQKNLGLRVANQQLQLENLKATINPHFIFNTLNNLNALIIREDKNLINFLGDFSVMLRYGIDEGRKNIVPLSKELACLRAYQRLIIMQEPLATDIDLYIEGAEAARYVPPFVLTSLVENAVKHSDINTNPNGHLHVQVSIASSMITAIIANSFTQKNALREGQGLQLIRKQLSLTYGAAYQLTTAVSANIYRCQLVMPTLKSTDDD